RPTRKPAIWVSVASPDMMRASTSAASSADRSRPDAMASMALVMTGSGIAQEVAQQRAPRLGEHRLGVELDSLRRPLAVAAPHHHATALRRPLEAGRRVGVDD